MYQINYAISILHISFHFKTSTIFSKSKYKQNFVKLLNLLQKPSKSNISVSETGTRSQCKVFVFVKRLLNILRHISIYIF